MTEDNTFNIDFQAEQSKFDQYITPTIKVNDSQYKIEMSEIKPPEPEKITIDPKTTVIPNREVMSPMSGKMDSYVLQTAPIVSQAEQAQALLANASSSQENLYKEMNTIHSALSELNSQIGKKQDLVRNDAALTESRVSIMQKNIMFYDRLGRSVGRPSWG
jgi:hypothetical protein